VGGLGLKDVSWGGWVVPERCIKYTSDWSYGATVADDLYSFILTKYDAQDYTRLSSVCK
jgi:hypothetical protein